MEKRLLTIAEAAEYLGLSVRSLYNTTGPRARVPFPVKPKRIGKRLRYDLRELDRFVDSLNALDSGSSDADPTR